MVELSIIIPLYNTEKYIAKCIQSCIDQTINKESFEIIIINDGSTDNSLDIAKTFADKHPKIKIISQANQKQGAARNNGLKQAMGEYIWFVDSDDWIEPNSCSEILDYLKINNVDVLRFDGVEHRQNKVKTRPCQHIPNHIYTGHEILLEDKFNVNVPLHIFNKRFLIKNNLLFLEGIFFEDNEFMLRIFEKVNAFKYLNKHCYNIFLREDSTTRTSDSLRYLDLLDVIKSHINLLQSRNLDSDVQMIFSKHISRCMNSLLLGTIKSSGTFYRAIRLLKSIDNLGVFVKNSGLNFHIIEYHCLSYPLFLRILMLTYYKSKY